MKQMIIIIEPCFFGVGYIRAAVASQIPLLAVVSSDKNPHTFGYADANIPMVVADIRSADSVLAAIHQHALTGHISAVIAGNQFTTDVAAYVAQALNVKGLPYEAARRGRLKDLAREAYAMAGVPSPAFARITTTEDAVNAASTIGYPVILKPTDSASSQHVYLIRNENELRSTMNDLSRFETTALGFKASREFLIEAYAIGPEYSVEVFLTSGTLLFAEVTEKTTTEPPFFVETLHVLPAPLHEEKRRRFIQIAHQALKALGIQDGPHHVELKDTAAGPVIIECNPRPAGDHISTDLVVEATRFNAFHSHLMWAQGKPCVLSEDPPKAAAVAFITADRQGVLQSLNGMNTALSQEGVVRGGLEKKAGDRVRPPQNSGDRIGYIIARGNNPQEAKNRALKAVASIRIEYTS